MIDIAIRKSPLRYREKWFFGEPLPSDAIRLVHYKQSHNDLSIRGFHREPFQTVVIDLSRSDTELFRSCSKTNQNEIRRAQREGVQCVLNDDIHNFVTFWSSHAKTIAVTKNRLQQYGHLLQLTAAVSNGNVLVAHAYLIDQSIGRARLLLSASRFEEAQTQQERQFTGRAHRLLIYREMLYFRDTGICLLDLGGCAPVNSDKKLQNINAFKFGFGGVRMQEIDYISYPLHFLRRLAQKIKFRWRTQ